MIILSTISKPTSLAKYIGFIASVKWLGVLTEEVA